jgi:hypothetical protein
MTSSQEPKSWLQAAMSNLLPYRPLDHTLPITGCPRPRTSSLDTLSARNVHRVLVWLPSVASTGSILKQLQN